jgi:peptidyl-prolyl cis-trans isomerase C
VDEQVLAKVGNEEITIAEFKQRFELVPQVNQNKKSLEARKAELLYTIIAEKLWAQEAEELGLDTSEVMQLTFKNIEKRYVRDALYKKEIESKIKIDDAAVREGLLRSRRKLNFQFLRTENKSDADSLYDYLTKRSSVDSQLQDRDETLFNDSLFTVSFGELSKGVEDQLYKLKLNEFSKPIEAGNGWYIFKLKSVNEKPFLDEKQLSKEYLNLKKSLEKNITNELNKAFLKDFFNDKKVTTDGYLFWSFSESLIDQLNKVKIEKNISINSNIELTIPDFKEIEERIGQDTLSMVFVEIEKKQITLNEFLKAFMYEGFYSNTTNPDTVRAKLNSRVKRFIEHELLSFEGFKRNYEQLAEVKLHTDIWRNNYLGKLFEKELIDTIEVSDEEAKQNFESKLNYSVPMQVNIFEILTDSLEVVEKVLNEIENGKRFQDLAREHTIREETKANNGEFGFFPITEHGEIGRIAADLELGEVYGPIKLDEGYSIFKLIGKREPEEKQNINFDQVKDSYVKQLKAKKLRQARINKTVDLANKYGITVDHNVLQSIKVKNLSMLVFKNFGFGGSGLALPIVPPFTEWVEPWQNSNQDLP